MLDHARTPRYLPARPDDLCPFCGASTKGFPVCKDCGAERIFSAGPSGLTPLYDLLYYFLLAGALLYFKDWILKIGYTLTGRLSSVISLDLWPFVSISFWLCLVFLAVGAILAIRELANSIPIKGECWERGRH